MNITPPVISQAKYVAYQQQASIATAVNGNLTANEVATLDTNGWPNSFNQGNSLQATVRVGALSSTEAIKWTPSNTQIAHNLGKIPTGWRVVYQDKVVTIIAGTTSPTTQFIYLTISDDTANTTLEIF